MVLKETLSYFANNGESVYCTLLDAMKAFDRVNYVKLFKFFVDKMLPPVSVQLMLNMYTSHVCCVSWNGVCSVPFSVLNGVKQDALYFYCIYLDKCLGKLGEEGVGCYFGNIFVGALTYADDIVLLAPTAGAIRLMQLILCYWLLELGLFDLCLVSVIIMC